MDGHSTIYEGTLFLNMFFPSALIGLNHEMSRVVLVRPGATDFDDQGRMKGCLDMPLSECGRVQVERIATELADLELDEILSAPCESALETANRLAQGRSIRVKVVDCFRNLDHGLWHGKLIEEVRRTLPRVYRQGQESPENLCPPGGETIEQARARVRKAITKISKRSGGDVIALVIPDPLASIVQGILEGEEMGDLWKSETDAAKWEVIQAV
jgi:broad specificity phosphatase PhoE